MTEQSVLTRQNGNGPAFSRELGCLCGRCRTIQFEMKGPSGKLEEFAGWPDPPSRAGTSASILTGINGLVKAHILIDVGPGVGDRVPLRSSNEAALRACTADHKVNSATPRCRTGR
jgi:hypothetical protein